MTFSVQNIGDGRCVNAEKISDFTPSHLIADVANLCCIIIAQFSKPTRVRSSFFHCITDIVSMCSNKQVIGIAARSIVTRMQNTFAVWNFAFLKLVGYSMRAGPLSILFRFSIASLFVNPSKPQPALIGCAYSNSFPKPNFVRRLLAPFCNCAHESHFDVRFVWSISHGGNFKGKE